MAIPHDPLFGNQNVYGEELSLAGLNASLRTLGLPDAAHRDIASYLGAGLNTVRAWFYPQRTVPGAVTIETEVVPWAQGYKKRELIQILRRSRSNFKRADILAYMRDVLEAPVLANASKAALIDYLDEEYLFSDVAAMMDSIFPREQETEVQGPTRTLPDMLEPDTYQGRRLSDFPRGTIARQKADLALALLGEVTQTPQAGVDEGQFREFRQNLRQIDETVIWPLRWGNGLTDNFGNEVARWVDPFIGEMWFRATLTPGPDMGGSDSKSALQRWQVTVEYFKVYEAKGLVFTSGWPERDEIELGPQRSKKEIADKIKEKADYEAYKKEQARKKRQKAKRNR